MGERETVLTPEPAMKEGPEVSVIIVSWNAVAYLEKCLRSLRTVTGVSLEIIVVDNASTDGSPEVVRRQYPDVILLEQASNTGFARANNIGIMRAGGRYLALINSDVEVEPGTIGCLVKYMDENARVGMTGPRIVGRDGMLQKSARRFPTLGRACCRSIGLDNLFPSLSFFSHEAQANVDVLSGCFWLVRREALHGVGLLDERFFMYGEDIDWCKRFNDKKWLVTYLPQVQALHYGGGSSANAPTFYYVAMQKAGVQYWRKHGGCSAAFAYTVILCVADLGRIVLNSIRYLGVTSKRGVYRQKIERSVASLRALCSISSRVSGGSP
jgi:GT2 family glycosyltransferase